MLLFHVHRRLFPSVGARNPRCSRGIDSTQFCNNMSRTEIGYLEFGLVHPVWSVLGERSEIEAIKNQKTRCKSIEIAITIYRHTYIHTHTYIHKSENKISNQSKSENKIADSQYIYTYTYVPDRLARFFMKSKVKVWQ